MTPPSPPLSPPLPLRASGSGGVSPEHPDPPAALRAESLTVRIGTRAVVEDMSLALQAGTWTAVVGPNGAGKSSLLQGLAGLRRAASGRVWLLDRPLEQWPAAERARRLAWLSQHAEATGELAARDVVALGRLPHHGLFGAPGATDRRAVEEALACTDCTALAGRRLDELSGGERQRVLLARALAVQAPVMLLDEPTTHLDAPHQQRLLAHLQALASAGATLACVLHDLNLALSAHRVLVMRAGRLCGDGAPGDPALQDALVRAFDGAVTIERLAGSGAHPGSSEAPGTPGATGATGAPGGTGSTEARWVAVLRDGPSRLPASGGPR